jgi:F-type H+-transporting ATPase subunit a
MATEGAQTPNEYIVHHLTNLTYGEGFWTVNVDSIFFSVVLAALFYWFFRRIAKGAKPGVPTRAQNLVELVIEFIDGLVRDVFSTKPSRIVAPLALTIFCWILLFNSMDWLPVDLLPLMSEQAGIHYLKVVPSTDLNITLGMSITVFLLCMYYSVKMKGAGGFAKELLTHPFGGAMFPANLLLNFIEIIARPVSLGLRLFGNLYAGEMIFLLLAVLGGAAALSSFGGWFMMLGHYLLGLAWALFHILVIPLQAFIFTVLTVVYMAMAHEVHDEHH